MLQGSCTCLSGFPFSGMVPHHDEQASENGNPERHVQLPCNMLPPYLCLLIAVTFSTPTPYYDNSTLGGNEFGSPLPQVSDDAGTPFSVVVIPVDDRLAVKRRPK